MLAACRSNFQLCQHVTQHQHIELHDALYLKLSLLTVLFVGFVCCETWIFQLMDNTPRNFLVLLLSV